MSIIYVLFNPTAGSGRFLNDRSAIQQFFQNDELNYFDITKIKDYDLFFKNIRTDVKLLLLGGDGTINRFVNDTDKVSFINDVYYYPTGTGNDFYNDVADVNDPKPILINKYIKNLPTVEVNGIKRKFLNGIGYGIDGFCCEEGDKLRQKSNKPVNYTNIAIKGLIYKYTPTTATVTIDGETSVYDKVWLIPTMNGRFFGGGIMPTPNQDRLNAEHLVSVAVMHGCNRLKTLLVFPSMFKGKHTKHTDIIKIYTVKNATVEFDRPCALQIDGETILNVKKYSVSAYSSDEAPNPAQNEQEPAVLC